MRFVLPFLWVSLACGSPVVKVVHQEDGRTTPPEGTTRLIVGGDSRNDGSHVLPWSFGEAKRLGAAGFIFLGDMELMPSFDGHFQQELELLAPIPFFPVLGNHEVKVLGEVDMGREHAERQFIAHFLNKPQTPVRSAMDGRVVYAVNLPGHVHFIALDNVTRNGFGQEQIEWLARDLEEARGNSDVDHIFVGMHKPLAGNGITSHSMEEDGQKGVDDSSAALELFVHWHVEIIFASHLHTYASFHQHGIRSYITGGLGAPLNLTKDREAFHHFLIVDVHHDDVKVDVVRFDGKPSTTVVDEGPGE